MSLTYTVCSNRRVQKLEYIENLRQNKKKKKKEDTFISLFVQGLKNDKEWYGSGNCYQVNTSVS